MGKENYKSLGFEYGNPNSLMFKKLRIVTSYISGGETLLDVGAGVGELIELEKRKFEKIYGIDTDEEAITICHKRFENDENIHIIRADINDLKSLFKDEKFDYITCLDVLEHIEVRACNNALKNIYDLLKDDGKFIFTGPGVLEKIRILLGRSPTHLHSHSSYGWKRIIERAGFDVRIAETVEFPIIHSNFLRKKLHLFGKCCLIVAEKDAGSVK